MKYINLTRGKVAIVDDEDFEKVNKTKWCYSKGYAIHHHYIKGSGRKHQKSKTIWMHRLILGTPHNKQTDHINGNKLDNRKSNLRVCLQPQNQGNEKLSKNNTSGYKGVVWHKKLNKWGAQIKINYKHIHLGVYTDKTEAARAYNQAALKYFGEFANINNI